ncbi:PDZ domain-containing protein [Paenibacillus tengchongensis]|uniref:PDZ domain-containing protein n=1 Tax=Paenibacillus tengchongensis TaxID=2608684 RepID=UPI001651F9CF|nr:PDZ domain-containing protein [Paenibacillus tengchongensis]
MTDWLASWGTAALKLLIQPYYYIAILFIMLYYRRQLASEREMIHVKLHSWGKETWRSLWTGLAVALPLSAAAAGLGISLPPAAVGLIWAVSLVLMLFRVRYLCFAYAVGLLGIAQFVLSFFPDSLRSGWPGTVAGALRAMDIPALLVLAALLHLCEALLARWQGAALATPLFLAGKRGKVVGAYRLEAFWPLPLFLLLPAGAGGGELPWQPLLGGSLGLVALPVLTGFSDVTQGLLPARKAARIAGRLALSGLVLLGAAALAAWWSPLTLPAALLAVLLREGLFHYGALEERGLSPAFVHPPAGRKVLAVLPGSPAEELGIRPGEVLLKVNGVLLTDAAALHEALRMNPAFCKLEVQNLEGESKYLQRAIYDGDHHQLGMILAPHSEELITAGAKPPGIFGIIGRRTGTLRRRPAQDGLSRGAAAEPAQKPAKG